MKPGFPFSHSSLNSYITCPSQYEALRVSKRFPREDSEASIWGSDVHEAIEKALTEGTPLPERMKQFEAYVSSLSCNTCEYYVELKLGVYEDGSPCDFDDPDCWARGIIDYLRIKSITGLSIDHKGLALDTPVLTETHGFVNISNIKIGDRVIGGNGLACNVIGKSPIFNRECYRIVFGDKSSIVCDNVHQWKLIGGEVVSTTDLQCKNKTPLALPVTLPYKELPIDPYVFGMWIADGKHTSAEISKPDQPIWDEIQRRGYEIGDDYSRNNDKCRQHTVKGIRGLLNDLGVIGNKHIPKLYLFASYEQRLDLLRGLMDGDGSVNQQRKQAVFATTNKALSDDVQYLINSLGNRCYQSQFTAKGFGKEVQAYYLYFRVLGANPFLLPRKADKINEMWGIGNSWYREIESISKIDSVPTQCISVDSSDHTYLCTKNLIVTHNTGRRREGSTQLKMSAGLIFARFPQLERIITGYAWLQEGGRISREEYKRSDIPKIWSSFSKDLKELQWSYETGNWPTRPSGLCGKWCQVTDCIYNGRRGKR